MKAQPRRTRHGMNSTGVTMTKKPEISEEDRLFKLVELARTSFDTIADLLADYKSSPCPECEALEIALETLEKLEYE